LHEDSLRVRDGFLKDVTNITDSVGSSFYGVKLQLKPRDRNQARGTTYKVLLHKTNALTGGAQNTFDVDRTIGEIRASGFSDLCVVRTPGNTVALQTCAGPLAQSWSLSAFEQNINQTGAVRSALVSTMCMTAFECNTQTNKKNPSCDPASTTLLAKNEIADPTADTYGSYVGMAPCGSGVDVKPAATWVQALDCAPGCAPIMLSINQCFPECNNAACNWGNMACGTPSPTPPTPAPTDNPTEQPSVSPSASPPTSDTPSPAASSTSFQAPISHSPVTTAQPTSSPRVLGTSNAQAQTPSSTSGPDLWYLWILGGFVLLALAVVVAMGLYRHRRRRSDPSKASAAPASPTPPKQPPVDDEAPAAPAAPAESAAVDIA